MIVKKNSMNMLKTYYLYIVNHIKGEIHIKKNILHIYILKHYHIN